MPDPVGRSRDAWSPYPAGGFAAPAATNRGVSVPRFTVQHDDRDDTIPAAWTHKGAPRPLLILADALAHKAVARFKRGRQATEDFTPVMTSATSSCGYAKPATCTWPST